MAMDLHLVLEHKGLGGILSQRLFFRTINSAFAFVYAASSRLPFIVCLGRWTEKPLRRRMRLSWSVLKEIPVVLARCAAKRASDQVEKPYPNSSGLVPTALRICSRNSGVARLGLPGGEMGRSAVAPPSRYSRRTRTTVSAVHPRCSAIAAIVSPASDIRTIKQLRKMSADFAVNRNRSSSFHCSSVSLTHQPMRTSRRLHRRKEDRQRLRK